MKMTLKSFCALNWSAFLVFFNTSPIQADPTPTPPLQTVSPSSPPPPLSREAATLRSKQIGRVSYTLWFQLDAEHPEFQAKTILQFDLKPKAKDAAKKILVDLEGGSLRSVQLNGTPLLDTASPDRFDGHHLTLKTDELLATSNRLEISYSHLYSTDGNGLHRFVDPIDHRVYLYSHFEPYNAHRMFPCFDQPDLKANFAMTVEAPSDWQVISNTLPQKVTDTTPATKATADKKIWNFPPSPLFSTYLFALHAGPYATWKSDANGIPLRLFARKSLAKDVDQQEWFKITQRGLAFYGMQFGFPYPFGKYDQIIVPEFNAGAMENVAAVTFSEKFIYQTRVTTDRLRSRADTILHEMAHMWFGDLVTMRWWNGLWLNESFATFMAAKAVEEATDFEGNWQAFFANTKQWSYWEDQLVTTHPIDLPAPDTAAAQASFDGITYGKGAASLKQLHFYLGEDDFREGLQRYFQKFAYKNTSLGDFMKILTEASSQDLTSWQHTWLQSVGVNTIRPEWQCDPDPKTGKLKISKFEIIQAGDPRPHRTQIATFHLPKKGGAQAPFILDQVFDLTYKSEHTLVPEALGKACPDFVFPNYKDQDYVKIELDPLSLKQVFRHLAQMTDSFTRQMIWHTVWEMVTDGKLRSQDYADLVLSQAGNEKNTQVLSKILKTLINPSAHSRTVCQFLAPNLRADYQKKIETYTKNHLKTATGGSDQQLIWYQAFLDSASSPSSLRWIKDLLDGKQNLKNFTKNFTMDQEHRWELLRVLARNGYPAIQEKLAAELLADPTDQGQKSAIAAEASRPDPESKKRWLTQITNPNPSSVNVPSPLTLGQLKEAMNHFQTLNQEAALKTSADAYFESLPQLALSSKIENQQYSQWFVHLMFPSLCDPEIVKRTTALLSTYPQLPAPIVKSLKVSRQEEERCILARERSQQPR